MPDPTPIPLNQYCGAVLKGLLRSLDWCTDPDQLVRAAKMLNKLPPIPAEPQAPIASHDTKATQASITAHLAAVAEHELAHDAWARTAWPVTLKPKNLAVVKACVLFYISKGKLGSSDLLLPLFEACGLGLDEEGI
jgi:hypothetical protein